MPIQRTVQPSMKSHNYSKVEILKSIYKMMFSVCHVFLVKFTDVHNKQTLCFFRNTDIKHSLTLETGKLKGNFPQ